MFINLIWILASIQISKGRVTCGDAYECVDDVINTDTFNGYGYRSNSGNEGYITAWQDAFCYGSYSCYNVLNISGPSIFCYGSNSCSNTLLYSSGFRSGLFCYGSNACSNSVIDGSGYDVFCYGDNGCSNTIIKHLSSNIYAYGAYSLNNATIQTDNTSVRVSIQLTGYNAGYKLKVICLSEDTCNIQCNGNACDSTIFDCQGIDNCDIQRYDTFYLDSFEYNDIIDMTEINNIDNNLCNDTNTIKVDNSYENYNSSMVNQLTDQTNICCRGGYSCYQIDTAVTSVNNLICSSSWACNKINVDNIINSIYCTGAGSCKSMYITASNVYCMGWSSCDSIHITAENVYLTGWISGNNITINGVKNLYRLNENQLIQTIISNGDLNAYFLNNLVSDSDIKIICNKNDNCMIKCATERSCIDTKIYCYGNCMVYCKLVNSDNDNNDYVCPNVTKVNGGTITYGYIYTDSPTATGAPITAIPTTASPTTNSPTTTTDVPSNNPTKTGYTAAPTTTTAIPSKLPTVTDYTYPPTTSPSRAPTPEGYTYGPTGSPIEKISTTSDNDGAGDNSTDSKTGLAAVPLYVWLILVAVFVILFVVFLLLLWYKKGKKVNTMDGGAGNQYVQLTDDDKK